MRSLLAVALVATSCGHVRPADPKQAPPPWAEERPVPPARAPAASPSPSPSPSPSTSTSTSTSMSPSPSPSPSVRVPRDAEVPGEGKPRPIVLPRPERATLACGAELLLVRRTRLPLVTVYAVWPTGAAQEPLDRAGLALLTADLLTEGAGARSALEVAAEAERLGVRLGSQASWDSTVVGMTALTRVLDPALSLFGDVMLRPRFLDGELERLRKTGKATIQAVLDQAANQAAIVGSRVLYGTRHRYGELPQGTSAGIDAIDRQAVVAWHRDHLAPSQATVIVVGDVDLKSMRARLDKLFGPRRADAPPAPSTAPAPPPPLGARRVVLVDRPGAAQTEIRAYLPGPPRLTPDYFPLLVLNTIFGGNFSSRLNAKLREEKGYTYGARSEFSFRRDGGPFTAGAPVKTAVTGPALADLRAELDRLVTGEFSEVEIRMAKDMLKRSQARTFETPPEVAAAIAAIRVFGLPDDYFATYARKVDEVTAQDLKRVAAQIRPDSLSLVFVGDEKVIGEPLRRALGPYEKVDARAAAGPVSPAAR